MELGPVNQLSQFLPIQLVAQAIGLWLRASDNEPVEIFAHRRACGLVMRVDVARARGERLVFSGRRYES